jgi:hypothetical protein
MVPTGPFSAENKVFEQHRDEWFHLHPGEFVAIQDDVIVEGFFGTYAEALRSGLQRFGVSRSFLVKQVWITEPVYCVS